MPSTGRMRNAPTVFITPHWDQESAAVVAHPSVNLGVAATQNADAESPGDFDAGVDLLPDEARVVARLLLEAADRVERAATAIVTT